jgi:hypothetical protein
LFRSFEHKLKTINSIIFTSLKQEFFGQILEETLLEEEDLVTVKINRHKASKVREEITSLYYSLETEREKQKKIKTFLKSSVLYQTFKTIYFSSPDLLRRREKAWEVQLSGEGAEDAGNFYHNKKKKNI